MSIQPCFNHVYSTQAEWLAKQDINVPNAPRWYSRQWDRSKATVPFAHLQGLLVPLKSSLLVHSIPMRGIARTVNTRYGVVLTFWGVVSILVARCVCLSWYAIWQVGRGHRSSAGATHLILGLVPHTPLPCSLPCLRERPSAGGVETCAAAIHSVCDYLLGSR